MAVNHHDQSGQPAQPRIGLHSEEVEDDRVHYSNRIVQPQYDKTPSENHYAPLSTVTTDASPGSTYTTAVQEQNSSQNYMQERALPAEPHYAETEYRVRKSSSVSYKRCLGYIVVLLVVLMICSTAIILGLSYMFRPTTSAEMRVNTVAMRSCPQPITVDAPDLYNSTTVFWNEPTAENPANGSSLRSHRPGDRFSIGSTEVLYTLIDLTGRKEACSFLVTVNDVTPPVLSNCPMDKEYFVSDTDKEFASWMEPTANDNSGDPIQVIQSHQQDYLFPAGDTEVIYQFIDSSGNRASCNFTITVNGLSPPNVTNCPQHITRSVPLGGQTSVPVWWIPPSATDPFGKTLSFERSHQPGDSFGVGRTTVTYTFTEPRGLQSTCEFIVVVIVIDGSVPTISNCPENIVRRAPTNGNSMDVWWTEPTATGASERTVSVIKSHPEYPPGSSFTIGSTIINYIFIDSIGLRDICSFLITVLDLTPPTVFQCPKEVVFDAKSKLDSVPVRWEKPYARDNSNNVTLISSSHASGSLFNVGNTTVKYVFSDTAGNSASCTFDVRGELKSSSSSARITNTAPFAFALVVSIIIWYGF